jgi:nicotinate phosphoribosyltransferase
MASAPEKASPYNLIRGPMAQSLLATDGYKFSMAEAGWPLRTETFYYSHRKGGPQVLPVDVPAFVRSLLPRPADDDYRYLAEHSYEMGPGFKAAIVQTDALEIRALPRGAIFYDREPVFTVTGPSALVSWLEPLVLMLHYRIQVASRSAPAARPASRGPATSCSPARWG